MKLVILLYDIILERNILPSVWCVFQHVSLASETECDQTCILEDRSITKSRIRELLQAVDHKLQQSFPVVPKIKKCHYIGK